MPEPKVGDLIIDQRTGRPRVVQSVDVENGRATLRPEDPIVSAGFEGVNVPQPTLLSAGSAMDAVAEDDPSLLQSLVMGFDPRTPEGRRNLAGTTGSILGSMAMTQVAGLAGGPPGEIAATGVNIVRGGRMALTAGRAVAPVVGAAVAGGAANVVDEFLDAPEPPPAPEGFGGPPRMPVPEPQRMGLVPAAGEFLRAGADPLFPGGGPAADFRQGAAEQGAYEIGGQVLGLAIKSIGKRLVGPVLAVQVSNSLKAARKEIQDTLKVTVRAARDQLRKAQDAAKLAGRAATRTLATVKAQANRAAQRGFGGPPLFRGTTLGGTPAQVGQAVEGVIRGPARSVRVELGELVGQAAEAGPPLDISPIKQQAQDVFDEQVRGVLQSFGLQGPPDSQVVGIVDNMLSAGVDEATKDSFTAALVDAGVDVGAARVTVDTAADPAFNKTIQLLRRFINADDTVPFADAHFLKRELRRRSGDFSQTATEQSVQLTRKFRSSLQELMNGASPEYAAANSAAGRVIDILEAPAARTLMKLANSSPDVLVRSLRQGNVTEARMWRDLLLEVAPQAGRPGSQEGRVTWDLLRSTWLKEHVLKGNADQLTDRLASLPPDFAEVMYGDAPGRSYLRGVRQIGEAYDAALQTARAAADRTEATGVAAIRGAERRGEVAADLLRETREGITREEFEFASSSIFKKRPIEFIGADVMKMMFLGVTNVWGAVASMRLIRGPKGADLIRWAALSSENTQMLVKTLTGPAPGAAMAAILRMPTIGGYLQDPTGHNLATFAEEEDAVTGQLPPTPPSLISDPVGAIAGLFSDDTLVASAGGPPPPR